MRHVLVVALLASIVFVASGCTSTKPVSIVPPDQSSITEIEAESRDQSGVVVLANGDSVSAERITVGSDSVRWSHPATGQGRAARAGCLRAIQFVRHGRGTLEGFGLGAGISMGAGLGTALVPSLWGGCEGLGALACGLAGMGVALLGTLVGTVAGAVRGHRDVYRFQDPVGEARDCSAVHRLGPNVEQGSASG